ncbi:helix-turn-helix transcriptional regulator [Prescottella agglutinans]|nr:helix-turn-helix domain-containing protein [Prescottella agglutinans]
MKEFLTTREVSDLTGIPQATLRTWRYQNCGPASFVVGRRRVMYRRTQLEAWFSANEESSTRGGIASGRVA